MSSRFPFSSYPDGWFMVAQADELLPGKVMPLRYFGQDLVLYRGESGVPHLLDAHCPHLGAHIGYGGQVTGNCVRCPFHRWSFDSEGHCVNIPYATKIPVRARLGTWPVREVNGAIMAYHHSGRQAPKSEPIYPKQGGATWTTARRARKKVRTHVQEFAENSVDVAHFPAIHGTATVPACEISLLDSGVFQSVLYMSFADAEAPGTLISGRAEVQLHGLGLTFTQTRIGNIETRILFTHTPIDDEYIDIQLQLQVMSDGGSAAASSVELGTLLGVYANLEKDILIWENKVYRDEPLLCEGDSFIGAFRRWARQFYSMPTPEATQPSLTARSRRCP